MNCIIFDIDGTLTQSTEFDSDCFKSAVLEHADVVFKEDWGEYEHVTDSGILKEIIESHDLNDDEVELTNRIKKSFIAKIDAHLSDNPAQEVPGAQQFLTYLRGIKRVSLAIATGGWGETAELKLKSAGIVFEDIPLCSANDAISRIDIMKLALSKAGQENPASIFYFGDAAWDKKACSDLNWNFVLVGDRTTHYQSIQNFAPFSEALKLCAL